MIGRDRYPHGVPCWIDSEQPDPDAATAFYGGVFGWEFTERHPSYRVARLRGHTVAAIGAGSGPATWNTYIGVDGADATVARVKHAGGRVLSAPSDLGDAARTAVLADPSGGVVRLWEARRLGGAQLVNSRGPGTSVTSTLPVPASRGRSTVPCSAGSPTTSTSAG